jgi:hypothetical protein
VGSGHETPQNQSISRPVLANHALTDVFLTFAQEPRLFLPRWSEEILEETRRAHEKLSWPVDLIDYFQQQVRGHFPEALVTNYKRYIDLCENDPKDRHVLAARLRDRLEGSKRVRALDARWLTNLSGGNLSLPRGTQTAGAGWYGEVGPIPGADQSIDNIMLILGSKETLENGRIFNDDNSFAYVTSPATRTRWQQIPILPNSDRKLKTAEECDRGLVSAHSSCLICPRSFIINCRHVSNHSSPRSGVPFGVLHHRVRLAP